MVDSVSSTVFGAQRVSGPSSSTYHLLSLPSCSSSAPRTAASSSFVPSDAPSLTAPQEVTSAEGSSESSSSSSSSASHPALADSSASVCLRGAPAQLRDLGSVHGQPDDPPNVLELESSISQSIDDAEAFGVGTSTAASSSACEVILVGHEPIVTSEIVIATEEELVEPAESSKDCPAIPEDPSGNSLAVSSSAMLLPAAEPLLNGLAEDEDSESTSKFLPSGGEVDSAASSVADIAEVAVVVGESAGAADSNVVELAVTSSASAAPASLSQPSTSRGTSSQPVRRKRRVSAVAEEAALVSAHVSGWARLASGLLDRVCRFRGAGRPKGMLPPAHWFLEPGMYAPAHSSRGRGERAQK